MPISTTGDGHVRRTVTDIARSRAFPDHRDPDGISLELVAGA